MIYYIAQTESYSSLAYSKINLVAFPSCDAASFISAHTDDVSVLPRYSITAIINSDGGDVSVPLFRYCLYYFRTLLSNSGCLVYQTSLNFLYILYSDSKYPQSVNALFYSHLTTCLV